MKHSIAGRAVIVLLLIMTAAGAFAEADDARLDLTIIGLPRSVLKMWDGPEVVIDPTGNYVIHDLKPGDVVIFTAEMPGYYPADYAIEMGTLSKTYRLSPAPTGVIAGELKFTDADFCPALGLELYFKPENAYASFDFYQSFLSFVPIFSGTPADLSSKYVMPMLGAGFYLLPYDSPVRLNLGASVGGVFGNELPHPLFAAEMSIGLEFEPVEHFSIFAEMNPRLLMPVEGGWDTYGDIFGSSRAQYMNALGSWALYGFPSTWVGFKYKY